MAGIDIVLNTVFNNPTLPVVPIYGFTDTFDRPDGPVGVTSREAKPWIKHAYPGADIEAVIEEGKLKATGSTSWNVWAVDAKTPNGVFRAVFSGLDALGGVRVAVRAQNATNFIVVRFLANGVIRLAKFISSTETEVAVTSAGAWTEAGVLEVGMDGASISVAWNGVQVISPRTINELSGMTDHGFMMRSESPNTRIDETAFIAG
ncbi:hypothetical protein [Glutamicibacter mysorens]|uniref:hypothetical protein n=1 Tax=Glutamicibacter mysorens TaxID=257984 RepID=UPI0020C626A4|nr:hypothetical protein [Glutamicibacter mysorens]UTM47041.1 hypothetical protein XH9_16125 [Glutamicibacter mysorens]